MFATVPSSGATTEFSIFIASNTKIVSPFFTACPGLALIDKTLPGIGAVTLMLPSAPDAAGAEAGAALAAGAAFAEKQRDFRKHPLPGNEPQNRGNHHTCRKEKTNINKRILQ